MYHLVPKYIYEKSINRLGNYNCSGFEDSNYIHSTTDLEELKKIADLIFTKARNYPKRPEVVGKYYEKPSTKFLLLKINTNKVNARIGFIKPSYYHIYGALPKNSYKILPVKRDKKGRFTFPKK